MLRSVQARLYRAEEAALARAECKGVTSHVQVQRLHAELAALRVQNAQVAVRNARLRHPLPPPAPPPAEEREALERERNAYVIRVEDALPRWREELLRARAAALSAQRAKSVENFELELAGRARLTDAERLAEEQRKLSAMDRETRACVRAALDVQAAGRREADAAMLDGASAEWATRSAAVLGQQLQV
ncbi:hypothetical protein T492DRAFT_895868 [Pavlovales sp. CCMP2436]|nr:hypothetical protein T492DRAFT_895868 [Pavlovales sp. CCMP2436]